MEQKSCPKCKSKDIIPILYGYPDNEMFAASDRDECILGGCCIALDENAQENLNKYHCKDCGYEWN